MKIKKDNHAAKFTFLYALSLVALIFIAISVGIIMFQIVNKSIIDTVSQYSGRYMAEILRFALSALLVSTPVFYLTTNKIYKSLFLGDLKKDSNIRKWLGYLILAVSSVAIMIGFVAVFNSFLNGELTTKVILKVLATFVISGITFSFYLYDMKREETEGKKDKVIKIYFWVSLALVIASFVAGLLFIDSPREVRRQKIDQTLLNNISFISNEIGTYNYSVNRLPEDLDELREHNHLSGVNFYDPETKEMIEYKIVNETEYQLCASFRTENIGYDQFQDREFYDEMKHESGPYCFDKKVYPKDNF